MWVGMPAYTGKMSPTLRCSYLRVYEPAEVLLAREREEIELASRAPASVARQPGPVGLLAPEECEPVYEKIVGGVRYLCPARMRLRRLLGMVAFERSLPAGAARAFFTPEELDAAHRELRQVSAPDAPQPAIAHSLWHVPLRWFACFSDEERRMEHEGDHPRIRYETTMVKARERVERAIQVLQRGAVHPVIVGMVSDLAEWLGAFDQRALLELDYASVSRFFAEEELADDHSAAEIWRSIEAIEAGDGAAAARFYQQANERWAQARRSESLN
jgi:hypothetical protein